MMASINTPQTYPPILPPCKPRKELANWTWVKLGSPKPKFDSLEEAEQRHWQRQNEITDNETERPEAAEPGQENSGNIPSDGNEEQH